MSKCGMIAGSFDLTTRGHIDVIAQAAKVVDKLYIMVATNVGKKPRFHITERIQVLRESLDAFKANNPFTCDVQIELLGPTKLLIDQAVELKVDVLFRGIRNTIDFEYEKNLADTNREIVEDIPTLFLTPKPNYAKISSSLVDGVVGLDHWETTIIKWVYYPAVIAYKDRERNKYSKISGIVAQ